jgi:ABC-type multidrug transport system permease subunit
MNLILLIAAIVVSFLIFTWLIKVVKATITTALLIALIVFGVQILFGIGPNEIWDQVKGLWEWLWRSLTGA